MDERKKKSYLFCRALHRPADSVRRLYPEKTEVIASNLRKITKLEKANEENLDLMAGLFGNIMAEIFAYRKDEWEDALRRFGFFLGKFIYLMDAYEDVEKDIADGCYNPLKKAFQNKDFDVYCKQILTMMIAECSREFERLPIITYAEILRNVLYSGIWCRYDSVTAKRNSQQEKKNE